jgi:hypothetical protein
LESTPHLFGRDLLGKIDLIDDDDLLLSLNLLKDLQVIGVEGRLIGINK